MIKIRCTNFVSNDTLYQMAGVYQESKTNAWGKMKICYKDFVSNETLQNGWFISKISDTWQIQKNEVCLKKHPKAEDSIVNSIITGLGPRGRNQ